MKKVHKMDNFITNYWAQITTAVVAIYGYARLSSRVKEHSDEIAELKLTVKDMSPVFTEIRTKLASIESTLTFLVGDRNKNG